MEEVVLDVVVVVVDDVVEVVVEVVGCAVVGAGVPRQARQVNGHATTIERWLQTVGSSETKSKHVALSWAVAQSIPATSAVVGDSVVGTPVGTPVGAAVLGVPVGSAVGGAVGLPEVGASLQMKQWLGQNELTPGMAQLETGSDAQVGRSGGRFDGRVAQTGGPVGAVVGVGSTGDAVGVGVVAQGTEQRSGQVAATVANEHWAALIEPHTGGSIPRAHVGDTDGARVGAAVGDSVGAAEGATVGTSVGAADGATVGVSEGAAVGSSVGAAEGANVGLAVVGARLGASVGKSVHEPQVAGHAALASGTESQKVR